MTFRVIDKITGEEPDTWEIAATEDWAKSLMYCDIEGFAVEEDGTLILMDECGKFEYCPVDRFKVVLDETEHIVAQLEAMQRELIGDAEYDEYHVGWNNALDAVMEVIQDVGSSRL